MSTHRLRSRSGMTLIEVLVALVVGLAVLQVALGFLGQQARAFSRGTTAMNAAQNGRYAVNALEKDVRTLGTGVAARQPALVYAGPDVLAFNADYATDQAGDVDAVYLDAGAPAGQLQAATPAERFTIPMTAFGYPDSAYYEGDTNSPAETLTFFFQPDPTTSRTDDYALYRQVNGAAPAVVARSLLPTGSNPFFEYLAVRVPEDGPTQMLSLGGGPLSHAAPLHGSPQDTGRLARVDSVRAVRVRFTVTNGVTGPQEQRRALERTIRMPNAGVATRNVCGDVPQPAGVGAQLTPLASGAWGVQLAWWPSVDEHGGEGDVLRYILWKRVLPDPFADPWVSIPAGLTAYGYVDEAVEPGPVVQYALAVQDCTPSRSAASISPAVAIPPVP
ncbi:MAG TPA: prepilin-type N-terminal cleavage/methylation domain-containing protein [Longimicrobium sp.]